MKVLVCGGRNYSNREAVNAALDALPFEVSILIEGGARGADMLGRMWAEARGIHTATVRALWKLKGKPAGGERNAAMLLLRPDYCVAFPGGTGTADMIRRCDTAGVIVWQPYPEESDK